MLTNLAKKEGSSAVDVALSFDVVHNENQVDKFIDTIGLDKSKAQLDQLEKIIITNPIGLFTLILTHKPRTYSLNMYVKTVRGALNLK